MRNIVWFTAFILFAQLCSAEEPKNDLSAEKSAALISVREKISALEELSNLGIITKQQAEQGITHYLDDAKKIAGRNVSLSDLTSLGASSVEASPNLTGLQKFAGLITFVNILWVIAIIGLVSCGTYLFGDLIVNVLKNLPSDFYEALFYGGSLALMIYGKYCSSAEVGAYVGFTGCILLAGALFITCCVRNFKPNPQVVSGFLFLAWSAAAIIYGSQMIGFIAVAALMSLLGFGFVVEPFVVAIGFDDESSLGKATSAAFAVLILYTALHILQVPVKFIDSFRTGALFLGSFVGYLGLDICSTRWYDGRNRNYVLFQFITIAAGLLALFVGSMYGIGELQKIGGSFFVLYLLTKLSEIPVESRRGYAALGLFMSGAIYWLCAYIKSNPDLFRQYLFMF